MVEVSVVLPCLNEEKTVGICIDKVKRLFKEQGIDGEIIVSDNGSTDDSAKISKERGAIVVYEANKGYGNAYKRGFVKARGKYLIMADADDTYDLLEAPKFLEPLKRGAADLVIGSRLKGDIMPGAMSWSHRHIGNPILTAILNALFHAGVSDAHCGMRAFTKEAYERLDLKTSGMEFASEMLIKASKEGLKIMEVPISYYARKGTSTKLKSISDGWRHLRFMLLFAPDWLFLAPGVIFFALGLLLISLVLGGPLVIGSMRFEIPLMIFGALLSMLGLQIILFGLQSKIYASSTGFEKEGGVVRFIGKNFTVEKGSLVGLGIFLLGIIILLQVLDTWVKTGSVGEVRLPLLGMSLMVIGLQIVFSSWFLSMIKIERGKNVG